MNLPTQTNKPSLSQVDSLIRVLNNTGDVKNHWDLNNSYSILNNITIYQYRYLVALVLNRKITKINKKLQDLGIKRIPKNQVVLLKPKNEIF